MAGQPSLAHAAAQTGRRYVLGAGRVYLALRKADGDIEDGERYIGSTPGFSLSVSNEQTEVYDDDGPVAERVIQITRQVAHTFSVQCKNVTAENLALFIGGAAGTQADVATSVLDEKIDHVEKDRFYKLGIKLATDATHKPAGIGAISATPAHTVVTPAAGNTSPWKGLARRSLTFSGGATGTASIGHAVSRVALYSAATAGVRYTETTDYTVDLATGVITRVASPTTFADGATVYADYPSDYEVDADTGRLYIPSTSAIPADATVYVDYTPIAKTRARVQFDEPQQIRAAIRYIEDAANKGAPNNSFGYEFYAPLCTITPGGDFAVKSRENPQTITLSVAVQEPSSGPSFVLLEQGA